VRREPVYGRTKPRRLSIGQPSAQALPSRSCVAGVGPSGQTMLPSEIDEGIAELLEDRG